MAQMKSPKPVGKAAQDAVSGLADLAESLGQAAKELLWPPPAKLTPAEEKKLEVLPLDAFKMLLEGNKRWVKGKLEHPHTNPSYVRGLAKGPQHPFAVIVCCSDSRDGPELLFDEGQGDLFVVRTAGNTAGRDQRGSVHYAVEHLGAKLIVVMGHTTCGAVAAAQENAEGHSGHVVDKNVEHIVKQITPAVRSAKSEAPDADHQEQARRAEQANVLRTIRKLKKDDKIAELVSKGELKIVGGIYDLSDQKVRWLKKTDAGPLLRELVEAGELTKQQMRNLLVSP